MIPVLSTEQLRAFDSLAAERCAVPGVVLMENAGRGAADVAARMLAERGLAVSAARVLVLCGPGNNGGDGYAVARRLVVLGADVNVVTIVDPRRLAGDAATMHRAWLGVGGAVIPCLDADALEPLRGELLVADLVVDALFGTGLSRPLEEHAVAVVEEIAAANCRVLALDVPSGLSADRGAALGAVVHAERTVTFAHPSPGLMTGPDLGAVGVLDVADIGVPPSLCDEVGVTAFVPELSDLAEWWVPRPRVTHKGQSGRVLVVAGGSGTLGAASLAARGALRAGAGLVTVAAPAELAAALAASLPEAMVVPRDGDWLGELAAPRWDAAVIGPGLGRGDGERALVQRLAVELAAPLVLDADALTLLGDAPEVLREAPAARVLTPHPGEAARLLGRDVASIQADRLRSLRELAERTGATVVLKGPGTLIGAPGAVPLIDVAGTALLATGGTGDVLAGVVAALLVGLTPREAAAIAAWLHGTAGTLARRGTEDRGVLASEVADAVPLAVSRIVEARRGESR